MPGYSETIESRRGEVLQPKTVANILKQHGLGIDSLLALCEEVGAVLERHPDGTYSWGEGEQVLWENVFEFLGY
jgi:precorrin-6B methylase 1